MRLHLLCVNLQVLTLKRSPCLLSFFENEQFPHVYLNLSVCVLPGLFEGSRMQYVSDSTLKIVFTCCQPSIVVSYDNVQGIHSVWALRKVTQDVSGHTYKNTHIHCLFQTLIFLPQSGAFYSPALSSRASWHTVGSDGFGFPNLSFA